MVAVGGSFRRWLPTLLLLAALPWAAGASGGLRITHVSCEPANFAPAAGETVRIAYRLSVPARVSVRIFDARDLTVRSFSPGKVQPEGLHLVEWDGRDENGIVAPPNFYTFVIDAEGEDGTKVAYDLTDLTGGRSLTVREPRFDAEQSVVRYVLPASAIVNVRAGLPDGGPLLATIVDWVARPGGPCGEPWDGWDESKSMDLRALGDLRIGVSAYELPANCIIVSGSGRETRPRFIEPHDHLVKKRAPAPDEPGRMYDHWRHPRDRCYDPKIRIAVPDTLKRTADGFPVVDGSVPLTLTVAADDQRYMLDQRFEVVFYVDFVFLFEEELGYTPFSWTWKPEGVNTGFHYITAMLRGYEGHFGTVTVKVWVDEVSSP